MAGPALIIWFPLCRSGSPVGEHDYCKPTATSKPANIKGFAVKTPTEMTNFAIALTLVVIEESKKNAGCEGPRYGTNVFECY
jgi:hypothetical protein